MTSLWVGLTLVMLLFVALFTCSQGHYAENESLISQRECNNGTLDDALSRITSNSYIELPPGLHLLSDLRIVYNVSNVTLYWTKDVQDTVIVCSEGVGLAIVGCSNVSLRNITISNCSLTGDNLTSALNLLDQSTYFLFIVPRRLKISLLLGSSEDIELQNVIVEDTDGLGLLAVNVLGNFMIKESAFLRNAPEGCFFVNLTNMDAGVGGGAIIIYHETSEPFAQGSMSTLSVTNTDFVNNSNCGASSSNLIYSRYRISFLKDYNASYVVGGGGGLTLLLSMYKYGLKVSINQVTFQNNTAQFGSGMFIGLFTAVSNTSITISNSTFESNGMSTSVDLTDPSFLNIGAAVTVLKDILYLQNTPYLDSLVKSGPNVLIFNNTQFLSNIGYSAGALYVCGLYSEVPSGNNDHIVLSSCSFDRNKAYLGAAAVLFEAKSTALQEGLELEMEDTTFTSNELLTFASGSSTFGNLGSSFLSSGIIELISMKLTLTGRSLFSSNSGTGIHAITSIVEIGGEATFEKNSGSYGGGMGVTESSFLLIKNNSDVKFTNNSAYIAGGGIYAGYLSAGLYYFDCFLFFDTIDISYELYNDYPKLDTLNVTISFEGNESPLGSIVYGSTLQTCSWITSQNINPTTNVFLYLEDIGIFKFQSQMDTNLFNTPPYQLEVLQSYNETIMPGQIVNISLVAYDRFDQSVPDPVTSTVVDGVVHGAYKTLLGASGYWFVNDNSNDSSVPIAFQSISNIPPEDAIVTVGVYSVGSSASLVLNFTLQQCYPGFVFPSTSNGSYATCVCSEVLVNSSHVQCNSTSAVITVYSGKWVGTVAGNDTLLVVTDCPFDYCKSGVKIVTNGIFDSQCSADFNRAGIACGQCMENYSIVIGSNRCQRCSNFYLFYLLLFAICGVFILSVVTRSTFTVSTGYFNSLVFYANVMALYQPYFLPNVDYYGLLSPILFWNLDIGYETCFYNGMTPLVKGYLRFAFPGYLWIVMAVYVLLGRRNIGRIRQNTPSAIASLMLLCYVSTLESCIAALSFLKVDGSGFLWLIDPSVEYFKGAHIPLGILSIIILVIYIVPFPILILVPALTLRTPFGKRLIPICDAFWAAYSPRFHFWEGLRIILRIIIFLSNFLIPLPLNVLVLGVVCVAMIVVTVVSFPYKNHWANIFEIFLLADLVLIVQGVLYFASTLNISEQINSVSVNNRIVIFTCLCLIPVYITWVVLSIYSFLKKHPKLKQKVLKGLSKLSKYLRRNSQGAVQLSDEEKDDNSVFEMNTHQVNVVSYSELREPLLDDPKVSDKPLLIACDD